MGIRVRRLTLLRHAHAGPADPATADRDRPLDDRGIHEAAEMGERLRIAGARPSLVLTSSAVRASQTARAIAKALGYPDEFIQREPALYLAGPGEILGAIGAIGAIDDTFSEILVCGHNPGISDLAGLLSGRALEPLGTAALVTLSFEGKDWLVAPGGATVLATDDPRNARDETTSV